MEIKKLNNLTYVLLFDTRVQAKKLFSYLYKASDKLCESINCPTCDLENGCLDYDKLMKALRNIAE